MSLIQIRDVPEATHRVLKARAAGEGRSLNAYLLDVMAREAARPTVEEVLRRAAARAEVAAVSSAAITRKGRDQRAADSGSPAR